MSPSRYAASRECAQDQDMDLTVERWGMADGSCAWRERRTGLCRTACASHACRRDAAATPASTAAIDATALSTSGDPVDALSIAATADPALDPVAVSTASPAPGQFVTATATVRNVGRGVAGAIGVGLFADAPGSGSLLASTTVAGGLAFNGTCTVEFAFAGAGGQQSMLPGGQRRKRHTSALACNVCRTLCG